MSALQVGRSSRAARRLAHIDPRLAPPGGESWRTRSAQVHKRCTCIKRAFKAVPDLAIEVVITSGGINRLAVYSRLQVSEVWFWQHERFSLYHLREETPAAFIQTYGYEEMAHSELLPHLDVEMLAAYVRHPDPLTAAKEFRQHLQAKRDRD